MTEATTTLTRAENLQLTIIAKTTAPRRSEQHWLAYRVVVVAMDHPGIVHPITDFFLR